MNNQVNIVVSLTEAMQGIGSALKSSPGSQGSFLPKLAEVIEKRKQEKLNTQESAQERKVKEEEKRTREGGGLAGQVATRAKELIFAIKNSIEKRTEEVGGFSGDISRANARIEIAKLRRDLALARESGKELAQIKEASAKIALLVGKIEDSIVSATVKLVGPIAEQVQILTELITEFLLGEKAEKQKEDALADFIGFLKDSANIEDTESGDKARQRARIFARERGIEIFARNNED